MVAYRTVVVGYDGSPDADRAVAAAADEVADGGTVHVVTAYHPVPVSDVMRRLDELPEEYRWVWDPHATETERQQAALARLRAHGVGCVGHVVADDPAKAVLDVSEREHADLVVVGGRGLGAVHRFLRGSVSARVAAHATTSVLVVQDARPAADG
ncbi:universal stress protein [Aquipuribacter nitratireducens]|uniref:Universal stress protein n=1 Tax=Aquipuribacter nitratireducens TaxID=650104 RepID=A0ABW0GKL0_9MICO